MKCITKWIVAAVIGLMLKDTVFLKDISASICHLLPQPMKVFAFKPLGLKRFCYLTSPDEIISKISNAGHPQSHFKQPNVLPPLETFVIEPIELNHLNIWVTADKMVPNINWMCFTVKDYKYTCTLPAKVDHTKSEDCPESIAWLLAEYCAPYHKDSLPLTILNGWKWEYLYNFSQVETEQYSVRSHGIWDNCLEAILSQSNGSICGRWLQIGQDGYLVDSAQMYEPKSNIEITSFSSIRRRHGYPKVRVLD